VLRWCGLWGREMKKGRNKWTEEEKRRDKRKE
jgi:hypothetical protein